MLRGENLRDVLPEKARPYAKAIYALIIGLVGLLVSLALIDDETGLKITQAVTALAVLLGVLEIPNQDHEPEQTVAPVDIDEPPAPTIQPAGASGTSGSTFRPSG